MAVESRVEDLGSGVQGFAAGALSKSTYLVFSYEPLRASIVTYTVLGFLIFECSIMYPRTLF